MSQIHRKTASTIAVTAVALMAVAVIATVYFVFDPSESGLFPRCPFLTMTGWRCPGCGSQRALHSLLHRDIAGAWRLNAMLLIELPLMVALTVAWLLRGRYPRFRKALNSQTLILTLLTLIIIWTIARNIAQI